MNSIKTKCIDKTSTSSVVLLRPVTERLNHLTAWLYLFLESDLYNVLHVLQFALEAFEFIIAVGNSLLNEWK